jgi:hypothetical protein
VQRSSSAREALVAELIGDVAKLLERVDTIAPAIDSARHETTLAAHELAASLAPFKAQIGQFADQTKKTAAQHIVAYANEAGARMLEVQRHAMSASARTIFEEELQPTLRELAAKLERLVVRIDRPWWESWACYAATAVTSAICSGALALHVVCK